MCAEGKCKTRALCDLEGHTAIALQNCHFLGPSRAGEESQSVLSRSSSPAGGTILYTNHRAQGSLQASEVGKDEELLVLSVLTTNP